MIKFLESRKIELCILISFIISIGFSYVDISFRYIPLVITFSIYFLLYGIRIFISFRQWKISKGISLINAYLNFQIAYTLMGIGYIFLHWPDYPLFTYNAITGPQYYLFIIGIFLAFWFNKINWKLYWMNLKENILKAIIGIIICLILFYSFDMASKLNPYPPHKGWITLPK